MVIAYANAPGKVASEKASGGHPTGGGAPRRAEATGRAGAACCSPDGTPAPKMSPALTTPPGGTTTLPATKANLPEQIQRAQTEVRRLGCFDGNFDSQMSTYPPPINKSPTVGNRPPTTKTPQPPCPACGSAPRQRFLTQSDTRSRARSSVRWGSRGSIIRRCPRLAASSTVAVASRPTRSSCWRRPPRVLPALLTWRKAASCWFRRPCWSAGSGRLLRSHKHLSPSGLHGAGPAQVDRGTALLCAGRMGQIARPRPRSRSAHLAHQAQEFGWPGSIVFSALRPCRVSNSSTKVRLGPSPT
jgi:hypothetical protein